MDKEYLNLLITFGILLFVNIFCYHAFFTLHLFKKQKKIKRIIFLFLNTMSFALLFVVIPIEKETKGHMINILSGFTGLIVVFFSKGNISNVFSGITFGLREIWEPGDRLIIEGIHYLVIENQVASLKLENLFGQFVYISYHELEKKKVTVVKNSIIETKIGLGYDVDKAKVKELLIAAGDSAGLKDVHVRFLKCLDYGFLVSVRGRLVDLSKFENTKSKLVEEVLVTLHNHNIEIATPALVDLRRNDQKKYLVNEKIDNSIELEVDNCSSQAHVSKIRFAIHKKMKALDEELEELKRRKKASRSRNKIQEEIIACKNASDATEDCKIIESNLEHVKKLRQEESSEVIEEKIKALENQIEKLKNGLEED